MRDLRVPKKEVSRHFRHPKKGKLEKRLVFKRLSK
nr:MAG TPA: hypothetical protein [Caudoviricetes sp.]